MLAENELKKLKTFDSNYFRGKSHFEKGGIQNYLVFQQMYRYLKVMVNTKYISWWKSKGLSDETRPPATSDNSLSPLFDYLDNKIRLKFNGGCLKQQNKPAYTHTIIVNICIVYEIGTSGSFSDDPTLKNTLFDAVKLTKNADMDKYLYFDYGIRFDRKGSFYFRVVDFVKM